MNLQQRRPGRASPERAYYDLEVLRIPSYRTDGFRYGDIQTSSPYLASKVQFSVFRPVKKITRLLLSNFRRWKQQLSHRCRYCNNLSPVWDLRSAPNTHGDRLFFSKAKLIDIVSHTSMCKYCYTIASAVSVLFPEIQNQTTEQITLTIEVWAGRPVEIFVENFEEYADLWLNIFAINGIPSPWPFLGTGSEVPRVAASEQTFRFIEQSLFRCIESHLLCTSVSAKRTPKRLLYVGTDTECIRLVEPENRKTYIQYLALSHCWGESLVCTTTQSTISSRKRQIQWAELSPVFQDAVLVAHRFKIPYIWVDSLCIIQDSREDWQIESADMARVYENAYFTVAAVSSGNGGISFLGLQRETQPFVELSFPTENSGGIPIGARRTFLRYCQSVSEGPLMKRAWAWQENILSKRIVQFTSSEVKWQCREASGCECTAFQDTGKLSVLSDEKGRDVYSQWHRLVHDYTGRSLTYISDRLPAMSGVASIIQNAISSDYLAGLWRNNLQFDLLWFCDPNEPLPRSVKWQDRETGEPIKPPTWSWASVDGKVQFLFAGQLHPYIAILNSQCLLTGLNPFGEVRGGAITIRSRTFDAILRSEDPSQRGGYAIQLFDVALDMKPDCLLRSRPPTNTPSKPSDGVERVFQEQDQVSSSTHEEHVDHGLRSITDSTVKCVLGCRLKLNSGTASTQFLVVSESPSVPGSFERIGWISLLRHLPEKLIMSGRMETLTLV